MRRRLALALTAVVLAALLTGIATIVTRNAGTSGQAPVPSGLDDAGSNGAPAEAQPDEPIQGGNVVPEVRQHIDGLRPPGLDRARDSLRERLDGGRPRR